MIKEDFDFILAERIQKIIVMDSQWNLQGKAYLSLSGGKDSLIVHKLLDIALPNNKIPMVVYMISMHLLNMNRRGYNYV